MDLLLLVDFQIPSRFIDQQETWRIYLIITPKVTAGGTRVKHGSVKNEKCNKNLKKT